MFGLRQRGRFPARVLGIAVIKALGSETMPQLHALRKE
jgi:hypothetical protein